MQLRQCGRADAIGVFVELLHTVEVVADASLLQQRAQPLNPYLVGTRLCGEITADTRARQLQSVEAVLLQIAPTIEKGGRNDDALLVQALRHGHGTGGVTAYIGVMGPVGNKARQEIGGSVVIADKYRRNQGDIRQVGPTKIRIVKHQHIPALPLLLLYQVAHGKSHTPQVHRDMRSLRKQLAAGPEQGAGEIQPVLDIGGECGALQHQPHLVADGRDTTGKQLEFDRVHGPKRLTKEPGQDNCRH